MITVPDLARFMQARIHDIASYAWAHELLPTPREKSDDSAA